MKDTLNVKGTVQATLFDEFGNIKEQQTVPNLVVQVGLNLIASAVKGNTITAMSHMAIGSGNTSPVAGNTTLETETARVALTSSTASTNNVVFVANYSAGVGTGAVEECGLFNAGTGGTMLSRSTNISLTKGASDTLQITWTITFG